jgi:hypothetical protein
MKIKRQIVFILLGAALASSSAFAASDAQLKAIKKTLAAAPVPELPAKAAELVSQAAPADREAVAIAAVRASIYKSRAAAPVIVSAISKAAPEVAASVSRAAAEMESSQSGYIAAAAISAAPQAKNDISAAVRQGASSGPSAGESVITAPVNSPGSAFSYVARGSSGGSGRADVIHSDKPINEHSGGNGHGRFDDAPPFGDVPPGHDPHHAGRPEFVDYTRPRH